jgi:hypothetical protein
VLPTSRNFTYIDGVTPLRAFDVNDIQDKIIALHTAIGSLDAELADEIIARQDALDAAIAALQTDIDTVRDGINAPAWWHVIAIAPTSTEGGNLSQATGATGLNSATATTFRVPFPVRPGSRIRRAMATARNSSAAALSIQFLHWTGLGDGEGAIATITPPTSSGSSLDPLTRFESGALNYLVGTSGAVCALVTMNSGGNAHRVGVVGIEVEPPAV